MKRLFIIAILVACTSLLVSTITLAQEPEPIKTTANLFSWFPVWWKGALFAGLGLIGALVTIFGLIGGAVPGTAGQVKIDADTAQLYRWSKQLGELIGAPTRDAAAIAAVGKAVNDLRDDLRMERRHQFAIATVLYALLGAFFSAFLAQDMLQALVIGAGWTGLLGTLGLKKDYAERKAKKDENQNHLLERVKQLEVELKEKGVSSKDMDLEAVDVLEEEVRIVQQL